ncbi:MAG: hypothetical protein HY537_02310 [Deltaproteobacteria bacterium]|nr:hypothetical protein [Deltaproteobacteria bacterium]
MFKHSLSITFAVLIITVVAALLGCSTKEQLKPSKMAGWTESATAAAIQTCEQPLSEALFNVERDKSKAVPICNCLVNEKASYQYTAEQFNQGWQDAASPIGVSIRKMLNECSTDNGEQIQVALANSVKGMIRSPNAESISDIIRKKYPPKPQRQQDQQKSEGGHQPNNHIATQHNPRPKAPAEEPMPTTRPLAEPKELTVAVGVEDAKTSTGITNANYALCADEKKDLFVLLNISNGEMKTVKTSDPVDGAQEVTYRDFKQVQVHLWDKATGWETEFMVAEPTSQVINSYIDFKFKRKEEPNELTVTFTNAGGGIFKTIENWSSAYISSKNPNFSEFLKCQLFQSRPSKKQLAEFGAINSDAVIQRSNRRQVQPLDFYRKQLSDVEYKLRFMLMGWIYDALKAECGVVIKEKEFRHYDIYNPTSKTNIGSITEKETRKDKLLSSHTHQLERHYKGDLGIGSILYSTNEVDRDGHIETIWAYGKRKLFKCQKGRHLFRAGLSKKYAVDPRRLRRGI